MGHGSTEQGDDAIAHHLVDAATERCDVVGETGKASVDEVLDLFGIA